MPKLLRNAFTSVFDLIVPPRRSNVLVRTLTFDALASLAEHDGSLPYTNPAVRALIWELKYRKSAQALSLAGRYLAELILAEGEESVGTPLLIPIPIHSLRRRERGYNQTEALCEAALSYLGDACTYTPHALMRVRHTPSQQGLRRSLRLKNVRGSMEANSHIVANRTCILVDDVTTTGATFAEARRALTEAGAAQVSSIALARSL